MSREGIELYQLKIAYDGTDYHGFQRQKGYVSIQSEIETALRKIGWKGTSIRAAGRTDAGVHATGQVVTFQLDWKHTHKELLTALNTYLPNDIAAQVVRSRPHDFHARYDALSRSYRYRLIISEIPHPLRERYAWRRYGKLDWDKMQEAAAAFIGKHEFKQFGKPIKPNGPTIRTVTVSEWTQIAEDEYCYEISAESFLYHMVRRITFVILQAGEGKTSLETIQKALQGEEAFINPGIAPACGLTLSQVKYKD